MHQTQSRRSDQFNHYNMIYTHQTKKSIYIGDLIAATNLNFIYSQNINTVITVALGLDQIDYKEFDIKHIKCPFIDNKKQNMSQFFDNFYQIIEKQIKNGNILVHCSAGKSRSPTLVISYLMKKLKWSFNQALQYVKSKRQQIALNQGNQKQLKIYQLAINNKVNQIKQRRVYCFTSDKRKPKTLLNITQKMQNLKFFPLKLEQKIKKYIDDLKSDNINKKTSHIRRRSLINISSSHNDAQHNTSFGKFKNDFELTQGNINNFQIIKIPIHQRFITKKKTFTAIRQKI